MTDLLRREVTVGDTFTECLVEKVSRAHIAQYAGSSGDFNLVHVDELFAVEHAGRPSVIAHGMWTMGLAGTFLTSLVGHGRVRRFGGRFRAPVVPGDRLSCTAVVEAVVGEADGGDLLINLTMSNSDGQTVFEGRASVRGLAA
jgi:acyl dehydratase